MTRNDAIIRLGVTGSAGTGKSTLARDLADRLGVPYVPEAMRALLEEGLDLHRLTRDEHRALLRRQADDLAARMAQTDGGFVTDRTPLDFVAFWLSNGYGVEAPRETEALMERAIVAMADYSDVVVLPWGVFAPPADGVRGTNLWLQLHFQTIIEGLLRRFVLPTRMHELPEQSGVDGDDPTFTDATGERADWVIRRVAGPSCLPGALN